MFIGLFPLYLMSQSDSPSCRWIMLTYMSIRDEIKHRISEGRLFLFQPKIPGGRVVRTIVMSTEINDLVNEPWPEGPEGVRRSFLRTDLEYFIGGGRINVCWEVGKGREHHQLGRLSPPEDEIWDYRSVTPPPALRLFCRFAEKDVLVVLTCSPRSVAVSWLDRLPLLDRASREWKLAKKECRAEWSKLFPTYPPLKKDSVHEYLSNAFLQ